MVYGRLQQSHLQRPSLYSPPNFRHSAAKIHLQLLFIHLQLGRCKCICCKCSYTDEIIKFHAYIFYYSILYPTGSPVPCPFRIELGPTSWASIGRRGLVIKHFMQYYKYESVIFGLSGYNMNFHGTEFLSFILGALLHLTWSRVRVDWNALLLFCKCDEPG